MHPQHAPSSLPPPSAQLPREFFADFVTVAADECRHFLLLERRLEAVGSLYGAPPALRAAASGAGSVVLGAGGGGSGLGALETNWKGR